MGVAEDRTVEQVQRGVLTTTQAVDRFGRAALRRHLAGGRWVKAGRGLVVLHNGPLLPEQSLWLAVLAGPRGTVLGSWSALAFDGLRVAEALPPHIVIPDAARRPVLPERLRDTLVTRCRFGLLQEIIDDLEGGERSVPEHRFSVLVRRAGLPALSRQAVVRGPFGRY